jgi:hypothetical protein
MHQIIPFGRGTTSGTDGVAGLGTVAGCSIGGGNGINLGSEPGAEPGLELGAPLPAGSAAGAAPEGPSGRSHLPS